MIANVEFFSYVFPRLVQSAFIMGISMFSLAFIFRFGIDLLLSVFKIIAK